MQDVVELVGLANATGRNYIHCLRHRGGVHCAVWITAGSCTYTKQEWLWRWSKTTRLVRTEAILTCQHYVEAPTRSWLPPSLSNDFPFSFVHLTPMDV